MEKVRLFVAGQDALVIDGILARASADSVWYCDGPCPDNAEIHGFYLPDTSHWNHEAWKPYEGAEIYKLDHLRNALAGNPLKVGQKVRFNQEKNYAWTVRAVREEFAILTKTIFGKGYYTIVDFIQGIRGPDNCYGVGYETDEEVAEAMLGLFDEHEYRQIEISHRHRIPLVFGGVKPEKEDRIVSLINRIGINELESIIDCPDDAVYFVDEYNEHFKRHGYCTDKFIFGVSNNGTHYKLEDVRRTLAEVKNV